MAFLVLLNFHMFPPVWPMVKEDLSYGLATYGEPLVIYPSSRVPGPTAKEKRISMLSIVVQERKSWKSQLVRQVAAIEIPSSST